MLAKLSAIGSKALVAFSASFHLTQEVIAMLTRSATMNKITDGVEGLRLIAEISSSYNMPRRSTTAASITHKIESPRLAAGSSCSATVGPSVDSVSKHLSSSPCLRRSSHTHSDPRSISKNSLKTAYLTAAASKAPRDRETRVREVKQRALKIRSTGNTPATEKQRLVMLMVFNEITPYPDEAWLSLLAVLIDREYHQVKNWFSNQRQKDSRENRENARYSVSHTTLASTLRKVTCEGRVLRLRASALECCKAEEWSDQFFEEVVMVHNVKILMRLRRLEAEVAGERSSKA